MDEKYHTLCQISDIHLFAKAEQRLLGRCTRESFRAVLKNIAEKQINFDAVVLSGDLSQDGSSESYRAIIEEMKDFLCPIYWIPGNHDHHGHMQQVFTHVFNNEKSFCLGRWAVILLNTLHPRHHDGVLSAQELKFLEQELAGHASSPILIFLHHHPIHVNSDWIDPFSLQNVQDFFKMIDPYPQVQLVVSGHVHQEFLAMRNSTLYLSTPSTCIQFLPNSAQFALDEQFPGYRILRLHEDGFFSSKVFRVAWSNEDLEKTSTGY